MTRNEKRLRAIEKLLSEKADAIDKVWAKAQEEDRETTADERGDVETLMKAIKELKVEKKDTEANLETEAEIRSLQKTPRGDDDEVVTQQEPRVKFEPQKSLGEMFTESAEFKAQEANGFSGRWSTGMVDLEAKGTLLEGSGASPGTGGAVAATVPQVVPGTVNKLFQRLTVADLMMSGSTSTNTVRYVVEGTATSGAAGVAEGAAKPESTLALSPVDEPVKKIATVLHVSDEMLEDAAQVQSYINGRLSLFVAIEEERQLLLGGGSNDLVGITGRTGVNTYAGGTAVGNRAVQLFAALNGTRGSSFLEPSAIIMNPADWQILRLLTDDNGQFFGGGPFTGAYGGPQGPVSAGGGQLTGGVDSIWGKPVVVTSAIGAGTAFLGAFSTAAQIYRRSGISVEASNSHDQHFVKNLVAIRAEERLALAVYRPAAFTKVVLA